MRFKSFTLARYGHFTDQPLIDFDRSSDFHIIVGRNEAGKSTLLHGIRDVLFGIDSRSPFNFLHDYKDLRLGAEIVGSNGESLSFSRRKGAKNTLLDTGDNALPDDALRAYLGPVDKAFFETMFGLDYQSLREGGRHLLAAGGESSSSLFGAASGLTSSLVVLADLDQRANALFTPRKVASKVFYAALDRRKEAREALRNATITTSEWERIVDEHAQAVGRVQSLEQDSWGRGAELAKANRALRVRPIILAIRQAEEAVTALANTPAIAATSFADYDDAAGKRDAAEHELTRIAADIGELHQQLDDLNIADELLVLGEDIDGLRDARGRIVAARNDVPRRQTALESLNRRIEEFVKDLGPVVEANSVADLVPPKTAIAQVRSLITEEATIRTSLDAARSEQGSALRVLDRTSEDLSALSSEKYDEGLEAIVAAVREPGNLDNLLRDASAAAADSERAMSDALAQLPLWRRTVEDLALAAVPMVDTVARFEDEFAEADSELKAVVEKLQANAEENEKLQVALDQLASDENLPTPVAIREARQRRDELWRAIRGFYIELPATLDEATLESLASKEQIPAVFEARVTQADALADRKEAEATRIAQLERFQGDLRQTTAKQAKLEAARTGAEERVESLRADWIAAWAAVVADPLPPREMGAWLAQRERVLELHRLHVAAERKRSELHGEHGRASVRLLASLQGEPGPSTSVTELLAKADAVIKAAQEAKTRRRELEAKQEAATEDLAKRTQAIKEATERFAQWKVQWAAAMSAIGQSPEQRADTAGVALELIEELGTSLIERAREEERLGGMRRDEQKFEGDVDRLNGRLGRQAAERDCVELFDAIHADCQATKTAATQRSLFEAQLKKLDTAKKEQEARRDSADAVLVRLRAEAGVENDERLLAVYRDAKARDELIQTIQTCEQRLFEAGDGLAFEQLKEEVDATAPEADRALVASTADTLRALNTELVDAKGRLNEVAARMREIESGSDAELYAERAEGALAELRDVTEEYALYRAAHVLLSSAIDAVRQSKQGPIVEAASELFARVTGGSYSSLVIGFDESDEPVLKGVRPGGEHVGVAGMSDGTRDQLFLALRLALVRRYVHDAEPLPFIADDLLVNFDDERAGEALRVLSALSKETQVMLYTHHPHLLDVAERVLGSEEFVRHELARARLEGAGA